MATTQQPKTVPEEQHERTIESDRLTRALTEAMTVRPRGPRQYDVTNAEGVTRAVDIETGTCQCSDYEYRGEEYYCKHVLRACVHAVFIDGVRTELQARVVAEVRALDCPHGHTSITAGADCAGPLGRSTFPCPDCVQASPGSWSAWKFLMEDETVAPDATPDAPRAMTDGGGR